MKIRVVKDLNGKVLGTYGGDEVDEGMELEEGDYVEEHEIDQSGDVDRLFEKLKKPGRRISR